MIFCYLVKLLAPGLLFGVQTLRREATWIVDNHVLMQVIAKFVLITPVAGGKVFLQEQIPFTHRVPPSTEFNSIFAVPCNWRNY